MIIGGNRPAKLSQIPHYGREKFKFIRPFFIILIATPIFGDCANEEALALTALCFIMPGKSWKQITS